MKATELKPGVFFEFRQPGYCFRRCMWIGVDDFNRLNFVHQTAGLSRFILNEEVQDRDPTVTIDVPQMWEPEIKYVDGYPKGGYWEAHVAPMERLDECPIDGYPGEDNK
jgi:hypothetical protein